MSSGAFSRVVHATRTTDKKEFAIKIVDKDETDAKDMYKELEVMSKLAHPNLVNFEEIYDERDGFYVVLELYAFRLSAMCSFVCSFHFVCLSFLPFPHGILSSHVAGLQVASCLTASSSCRSTLRRTPPQSSRTRCWACSTCTREDSHTATSRYEGRVGEEAYSLLLGFYFCLIILCFYYDSHLDFALFFHSILSSHVQPENLLLASKDSNAHVKVADFGFSTSTHNDHDLWETLGTPPYMAPEIVILRNEDVEESGYGRPVDVWALGICLYILYACVSFRFVFCCSCSCFFFPVSFRCRFASLYFLCCFCLGEARFPLCVSRSVTEC
jgi:serine/threonine protein kinase